MRKNIVGLIGASFLALSMAGCSHDNATAAQRAAAAWLKLVDSGNYAQSWEEAAAIMKASVAKDQWQAILQANRAPLGALLSRKLTSAESTTELPGAPPGQYVVLEYASRFEHRNNAIETATSTLDKDGQWRVSLYVIK
ncbi:MAG TPA: DUF4019 domain-containing protein [Terriglobales bacterium]|nr:DUF4019 domain-containing protein [Terriglobales bacterium]